MADTTGIKEPSLLLDRVVHITMGGDMAVESGNGGGGGGTPPTGPTADFSFLVAEKVVTFTDLSMAGSSPIISYLWDFGDGSTSTVQNPTHTYADIATYTVTLTATDGNDLTNTHPETVRTTAATDPYFANVVLLLHFDGTEGSTSIVDSSNLNNSMQCVANAHLTTANSKWGDSCLDLGSSFNAGVITTGSMTPFTLGTQEWTFEAWVYLTADPANGNFLLNFGRFGGNQSYQFWIAFKYDFGGPDHAYISEVTNGASPHLIEDANQPIVGQWQFVQVRRRTSGASSYIEMAIDGSFGTTDDIGATYSLEAPVDFLALGGLNDSGSAAYAGQLDEVRFTVGVARPFAIPTGPFPDA